MRQAGTIQNAASSFHFHYALKVAGTHPDDGFMSQLARLARPRNVVRIPHFLPMCLCMLCSPCAMSCVLVCKHSLYDLLTVRLVNGPSSSQGRLEVYYRGRWGTVCDDGFSNVDARVACYSMGYG